MRVGSPRTEPASRTASCLGPGYHALTEGAVHVPIRTLTALAVVAILLATAAWSVWVLPRAPWLSMPAPGRIVLTLLVTLSLLAAAGWVYFVLPAYWD
jgi:hypothetical protein